MHTDFGWEEGQRAKNAEGINIYKGIIFTILFK
jgi:hypothetical protein